MSNEEIRELIRIAVDSGVAELEVERGNSRVRIRLDSPGNTQLAVPAAPAASAQASAAAGAQPSQSQAPHAPAPGQADTVLVKSPIVGTFYEAPSQDAAPFVRVGDSIEPGQVLCIIESMKLMNEIEAEIAGTIVSKLMENGRPVEYGEALFAIRPR